MKKRFYTLFIICTSVIASMAETKTVTSPDGRLCVDINCHDGIVTYNACYDGKEMLRPSRLGIKTEMGDYTKDLKLERSFTGTVSSDYTMRGTKKAGNKYENIYRKCAYRRKY